MTKRKTKFRKKRKTSTISTTPPRKQKVPVRLLTASQKVKIAFLLVDRGHLRRSKESRNLVPALVRLPCLVSIHLAVIAVRLLIHQTFRLVMLSSEFPAPTRPCPLQTPLYRTQHSKVLGTSFTLLVAWLGGVEFQRIGMQTSRR